MNKLVYVGFAYLHHMGGHAGYHQIKDYLGYDYIVDAQKYHNNYAIKSRWHIVEQIKYYILPYFCFGFSAFPWYIIKCIWLALTKGNLTFHFIYGENLYVNTRLLRIRNCKTVLTIHQPYEWFVGKQSWHKKLKTVDHIILVGETEVPQFKQLTGKDNVTFIPHGICSKFYCPDTTINKERMVLTVGNWLRDFKFADKVYQQILGKDNDVHIVVVTNPKNKALVTANERIIFKSGITDEELRDLYRKTSCLFLPLKRYTANNALLEAGAVGCPILIACNEPDNSYIPKELISLLPMSVEQVCKNIKLMLDTKKTTSEINSYVEKKYSWPIIADITKTLLMNI